MKNFAKLLVLSSVLLLSNGDPFQSMLTAVNKTVQNLKSQFGEHRQDQLLFQENLEKALDTTVDLLQSENIQLRSGCKEPVAIQGLPGEVGPIGPPGPQGNMGPQGMPGLHGLDGTPGADANVTALNFQLEALWELLRNNSNDLNSLISPGICGGFVDLDGQDEITYQLPKNFRPNYQMSCAWVVWAKKGGPIKLKSQYDYPVSSGINVIVGFDNRTTISGSIRINGTQDVIFMNNYIVLHMFARPSRSSQQLRLTLKDEGRKVKRLTPTNFTISDHPDVPYTLQYPSESESYGPQERVFALYKASPGKQLTATVNATDIEECCDELKLSWLDPSDPTKLQYRRFSGEATVPRNVQLPSDTPLVLSFVSDEDTEGRGFTVSHAYN